LVFKHREENFFYVVRLLKDFFSQNEKWHLLGE